MSKIEELAHSFAIRQWGKPVPHTVREYEAILKEFCGEIMAMPLSERLNEDEKERIRNIYNCKRYRTEFSKEVECMEKQLLEYLFGADFFKKDRE